MIPPKMFAPFDNCAIFSYHSINSALFSYHSVSPALAFYTQWQLFGLKFSTRSEEVKASELVYIIRLAKQEHQIH